MATEFVKDLVVLVADKDMEQAVDTILVHRRESLSLRPVTFDILAHPEHDPGVRTRAAELLRVYLRSHRYALVIFDRSGCGSPVPAAELEEAVRQNLAGNGWSSRSEVVVVDPELEAWVWSTSPHVPACMGWHDWTSLRSFLESRNLWPAGATKPPDPVAAFEEALRYAKTPRSSAIFADIASRVSLASCTDPAFGRLRSVLLEWFAQTSPGPTGTA